jgi:hypothetical protein
MTSACEKCEEKLGWDKPTMVAWVGEEMYAFCSIGCREKWFYSNVPSSESGDVVD